MAELVNSPSRKIVLSGLRPTGRVHLGNYWGAVKNWVDLQADYDCRYFVADLHALTTDYADTSTIREATLEAVTDWLAVGLDPEKSVIFVQSRVPQTAELALVFGMITPLGWLERVPTYKEQIEQLRERDLGTFGFLGYPVLMTADIALYRAHYVPVGKDQESHLEICREIVRRFNGFYGDVFPEPQALYTATPKVPGLDGRKMSKTYNNAIALSDSAAEVEKKVMGMVTDPGRARRADPGNPDVCNLYPFHVLYSPPEEQKQVDFECRTAARGCVDCKKHLIRNMNAALEPVLQRRAEITAKPGFVKDVLEAGNERARDIASETMEEVSNAMRLL
jgi:tryptophanyl-tRNA synthetase